MLSDDDDDDEDDDDDDDDDGREKGQKWKMAKNGRWTANNWPPIGEGGPLMGGAHLPNKTICVHYLSLSRSERP